MMYLMRSYTSLGIKVAKRAAVRPCSPSFSSLAPPRQTSSSPVWRISSASNIKHPLTPSSSSSALRRRPSPLLTVATASPYATTSSSSSSPPTHQHHQPPSSSPVSSPQSQHYAVVNFYHLVDITKPGDIVEQSKQYLQDKDVKGRIYFSHQGVNAQYGGTKHDAVAYVQWLTSTFPDLFTGLFYTVWKADDHMFPKLRLKYKPNLISLAGGMATVPVTDPNARATKVPPAVWKRMLAQTHKLLSTQEIREQQSNQDQKSPIVLDLRNSYEWDAGHFAGAERPREDEFNETPTEATPSGIPAPLQNVDPNTPVMMYCTGGIRCDVYSAYLKQKGYKNLYSLEGGVQNYLRKEGVDHWNGSLFVFDGRMAIRPTGSEEEEEGGMTGAGTGADNNSSKKAEELPAAAPCQVCGGTAILPHINCANIDCNKLFIACEECRSTYKGCCCSECTDAPRLLRPIKIAGQYGNIMKYVDDNEEEGEATREAIRGGRGDGRKKKRQRRLEVLREREQVRREEKMEKKKLVRAWMEQAAVTLQSASSEYDNNGGGGGESEGGKMARLQELRSKLRAPSSSRPSARTGRT